MNKFYRQVGDAGRRKANEIGKVSILALDIRWNYVVTLNCVQVFNSSLARQTFFLSFPE
jgi:hypothetical protein